MVIKENQLYNGLKFKSGFDEYIIYDLNKGQIQSIKGKNVYNGYKIQDFLDFINRGSWKLIDPIKPKIYELW
jgi:hypothetical protein